MPKLTKSLIAKIRVDYPELTLTEGERFKFSPPRTVYYTSGHPLELLHELGHYLIGEQDYVSDIELIEIESRAWAKAKELCATYDVVWDEDYAENHLDSYRDWLHVTSLCRICNLAGYQDDAGLYHCPLCGASWPSRYRPE